MDTGGHNRESLTAILLSTFNGARFLRPQIDSFLDQTHTGWTLCWRDDGSSDDTVALMRGFAGGILAGRVIDANDGARLRVLGSFLRLLAIARDGPAAFFAFADQDDVWLPRKIARAVAALRDVPPDVPALYCARQRLVDADLRPIGESPPFRRPPGFPAALAQNIATGCTMLLNRAAADLILATPPPASAVHDWWSYLVVSAAGGVVIADPEPALLYRQHGGNVIGAPAGLIRRATAALRRGPGTFMEGLRAHVAALLAHPAPLTPTARDQLEVIAAALAGGPLARTRALCLPGFARQTLLETFTFRLWFLLG